MEAIIELATKISTPLALGGLTATILFFILRQLIKNNTFPTLTKSSGAYIIKFFIDRLFILALVAMAFGFAGYVMKPIEDEKPSEPIVEPAPQPVKISCKLIKKEGKIIDQSNRLEWFELHQSMKWDDIPEHKQYKLPTVKQLKKLSKFVTKHKHCNLLNSERYWSRDAGGSGYSAYMLSIESEELMLTLKENEGSVILVRSY